LTLAQATQQAKDAFLRDDWAEAERLCRLILIDKFDHFEALNLVGMIAAQTGRSQEAVEWLLRAVSVAPDRANAHGNLGNVLHDLHRHEEALESYNRALNIDPENAQAYCNRAIVLDDLMRHGEARESYERALKIEPDNANIHWNLALRRLQVGDFARGWEGYEWRSKEAALGKNGRSFSQPLWLGAESLAGKTILLHSEQGLGDTLQFCRYVKLVAALGAQTVLEVQPPLVRMLVDLEGATQVVAQGFPLPAFNYHCPLLSLPLAFRTELDTIPVDIPYLRHNAARLAAWRDKLGAKTKPRVGWVWCGSTTHKNDHNRSLALTDFIPLLADWVDSISLQKEIRIGEAEILASRRNIRHFGAELHDFTDTAALVALMDVVITVDTSVAHLAGAMGKTVWILLPHNPDWRWMLDRDDSPWYPTARLFRQPAFGDWKNVIQRVRAELALHCAGFGSISPALANNHRRTHLPSASPNETPATHPLQVRAPGGRAGTVSLTQSTKEANAAYQCNERAEAERLCRAMLNTKPDYFEALNLLAIIALQSQRTLEAVELLSKAAAAEPYRADVHSNLGYALNLLNHHQEALEHCDNALKIQPDFADALYNRGNVLRNLKRHAEAIVTFQHALRIRPGYVSVRLNLALCHLQLGDFTRGWPEYEWRWQEGQLEKAKRSFSQPLWLGTESLKGKTILLHSEQGLGDALHFCRYAKRVAALGAQVILEVPHPLLPLLADLEGTHQVLSTGAALPRFDYHCPLLSLPLAFKTELDTIPADVPYIHADPARVALWQSRLGQKTKPRIGLVWSGSAMHKNDHNRSIALLQMLPLLGHLAECISLQQDVSKSDAALLASRTDIRHFGGLLSDFADTAALIELTDFVVTVDTSAAHLAGAMGKTVWILLSFDPDWRWLLDREDNPWYPTARLFRQPAFADWKSVVDRIGRELAFLHNNSGAISAPVARRDLQQTRSILVEQNMPVEKVQPPTCPPATNGMRRRVIYWYLIGGIALAVFLFFATRAIT
jgi:tetratricopeptide (TPR) repeat protein